MISIWATVHNYDTEGSRGCELLFGTDLGFAEAGRCACFVSRGEQATKNQGGGWRGGCSGERGGVGEGGGDVGRGSVLLA